MNTTPKVILLILTIILNFFLLGIGLVLGYDLIFPPKKSLAVQSSVRLGSGAKSRITNILSIEDKSIDQINTMVFSWMKQNHLVYTALYDAQGRALFRNYHPGKITKKSLSDLKNHFDTYRISNESRNEKHSQYQLEVIPLNISKNADQIRYTLHTAKLQQVIRVGIYNRWLSSARNALEMIFGGATIFIALGLILTGSSLAFSSCRELKKMTYKKTRQPGLTIELTDRLDASLPDEAGYRSSKKPDQDGIKPNAGRPEQTSDEDGTDQYVWEFKQERWNLPGFLSVINPVGNDFYAQEPESWQQYFRNPVANENNYRKTSYFDFQFYRFESMPEYPEFLLGVERFSRIFLQKIVDIASELEVTLYLKNRKNNFDPVLSKKGNLFVSGDAIDHGQTPAEILQELHKHCYVLQNEGKDIYFPLPTRKGVSGVIHCKSGSPLYNKNLLSRLWFEIRKFGESLYQVKVYEQATIDPVSCLGNGMSFYKDLEVNFHLKKEVIHKRQLSLIQFIHQESSDQMHWIGPALRAHFHASIQIYRLADDVCALLGPNIPEEIFSTRVAELVDFITSYHPCEFSIGIALLENEVSSPNEWFSHAAAALGESRMDGPNRYQYFKSNRDSYQFVPDSF